MAKLTLLCHIGHREDVKQYGLAGLAALEGRHDDALASLEIALTADPKAVARWARTDAAWEELRSDDGFQAALARHGDS